MSFEIDEKEIEQIINSTDEETERKIDWSSAWGKKYTVLTTYRERVVVNDYADKLTQLLDSLKTEYGYNDLDSMLVLKDILYHVWKTKKY